LTQSLYHMEERIKDQVAASTLLEWRVSEDGPQRLDAFVCQRLPHLSLRRVRALIEEGGCTVNGRRSRKGRIVFSGDVVAFRGDPRYLARVPVAREPWLTILYEDDWLIAVDKPSGMPTHGHSGKDDATLVNHLLGMRPQLSGIGRGRWEPGILHRLDRDTSGIVLAAKQQGAFGHVRRQFEQPPSDGDIDRPLAHDPLDRRKMRACSAHRADAVRTWEASTHFWTIGREEAYSLLEVKIATGVTHQIRAHMQTIGHPIAGDPLYGCSRDGFGRCMLHACRLELQHPEHGTRVVIQSPSPAEFNRFEEALRRSSRREQRDATRP